MGLLLTIEEEEDPAKESGIKIEAATNLSFSYYFFATFLSHFEFLLLSYH